MNMISLLLNMWVITTYPDIELSHKQYDDTDPFQLITLDCAIPASEVEKDSVKLSVIVTYNGPGSCSS